MNLLEFETFLMFLGLDKKMVAGINFPEKLGLLPKAKTG